MTTPQAQFATLFFVVGMTCVILAYDVAAFYAWGRHGTISMAVTRAFRAWPVLCPLLCVWIGILIGHWCFPCE